MPGKGVRRPGGSIFTTAEDFRTLRRNTLLCSIALAMDGQAPSKTERKRKIKRAVPVARMGLSMEMRSLLKFLRETIADRRRNPRAA